MNTITSLKELPFRDYTGYLLPNVDDAKNVEGFEDGYLYISTSPKMIILFINFVNEIDKRVVK